MSNKTRKKQIENQAQEGRSMVEMLGVLAIIGVLSLGGIAGYRMAMNRYQANQIANEINLMRTDAKVKAAAQVTGKLMLGEPYDSGHLNFGTNYEVAFDFIEIESEDEGVTEAGYYIKISGISADVCKPLVTLLNGMNETVALKVNEVEYSADSSTDLCTEESNNALEVDFSTEKIISNSGEEPEPPEEQGDEPQDDDPVCDETTCLGGECQADGTCKCNDENEYWTGYGCTACPAGAQQADGTCECTGESHLKGSQCITCPEEAPWSDAADDCVCTDTSKSWSSDGKCIENVCNSGQPCPDDAEGNPQYCDMDNGSLSCNNGVPSASSGTCTSVTDGSYREVTVTNSAGGIKTIYVSNEKMDWWAAGAFCQALGRKLGKPMHLVSVGDLGCSKGGYCPEDSYGKSLADKIGSGWGWTSTPYKHDNISCSAYDVYLGTGYIDYYTRNCLGNGSALCE